MSHRLMARLQFDAGRLREILQLPEMAEIVNCRMVFDQRGMMELLIEGAGFPTKEGAIIQPTTARITTHKLSDGIELKPRIEWAFAD